MKPVAFILEASSISGGVRIIYEYASRLKKRGHSVHIWSLGNPPNWFDLGDVHWAQFQDYGQMLGFMKNDGRNFAKIATWWRTAKLLNEDKGSLERGEAYYLVQDVESSYYYRPVEKQAVVETYGYGLKMFTCNEWVTTLLPMPCVGQAYDKQMFFRMKYTYPSDRVALSFMRRQALKGFCQLGEFSRRLKVIDPKAELWTLGIDGGQRLLGAHSAHFVNLPDAEVRKKYNEATVFVILSCHEGFSLPALEAMACGTPVVCFRAEGNEVFCKHDVNCLMAEKGDVETFTAYALEAMKDRKLRAKLIESGFETARRYSDWDSVIDKLEAVLNE